MLASQIVRDDMAEQKILIVGLGQTGLSCARYLVGKGYPVAVTDSRVNPPGLDVLSAEYPDVAIFAGGFDSSAFSTAKQIIVSPGVSLDEPLIAEAIQQGKSVIGDVELFAQNVAAPVVAITGSNGKSTVTTLLGEMVKAAGCAVRVGGNLGTPVLELLQDADGIEFFIIELSSFQLETTHSLDSVASVVLNISADHMDRYRDLQHYINVKRRVTQGGGVVVVNKDDGYTSELNEAGRNIIYFGLGEPADNEYGLRTVSGELWLARGEENIVKAAELKLHGLYNYSNVLAAFALSEAIGLSLHDVLPCVLDFPGLPHRMRWVASINEVSWYNDSKATNVGAAVAAIDSLTEEVVLIAGGEGKEADFSQMRDVVNKKVKAVILIGKDAQIIADALLGTTDISFAVDMEAAVRQAAEIAMPGDVVLLAPACASFDMYSGYEQRGLDFMTRIKALADQSVVDNSVNPSDKDKRD